jgi:CRP/FNR family transcriptional regulator, cyclic AMP receptor protein
MEDCTITRISKKAMITALESKPKFSQLFMAYLLARNSRIEEDLIDQLFNSSEKRLARLLLLLANFGKERLIFAVGAGFNALAQPLLDCPSLPF